jgi:hypothetical protein
LIRVLLSNPNANAQAIINASITKGILKSLAEPNLLTLPGKEASFLAGGEFPYPTVQSGSSGAGVTANNAVTITFREFGIRLNFTPTIMQSGAIRLKVAPEVSALDFANGLTISGFEVPTILVRRASTEVELREGQYLALGRTDRQLDNRKRLQDPGPGGHSDPGSLLSLEPDQGTSNRAAGSGNSAPGPCQQCPHSGADRRAADLEMARMDAARARNATVALGQQPHDCRFLAADNAAEAIRKIRE